MHVRQSLVSIGRKAESKLSGEPVQKVEELAVYLLETVSSI